jgi:hypothetical protein
LNTRKHVHAAVAAAGIIALAACSPEQPAPDTSAADASPAATATATPATPQRPDYARDGLRADVERLVAEVAATPTTPATLKARAWTLWEWANAYALAGLPLHSDLSSAMASIAALPDPVPETDIIRLRARQVDDWVRELSFREANPDAIGTLTTPNRGPFPVDSQQTLTQVYTVGSAPMGPGAGVLATIWAYGTPLPIQNTDPAGAGYVRIESSNPAVRFNATTLPLSGMHTGTLSGSNIPRPFFEVVEGTLQPGDTVTVHMGDRAQGGAGLRLPSPSSSGHRARLWIRLAADGVVFPLPEIGFLTEGLETAGVRGFAPSVAGVGEPVRVSVRAEDRFRNRATSGFPVFVVRSGEREIARVPADGQALHQVTAQFDAPGVQYLTIASEDGTIRGEVNPILVEAAPAQRIYWGETHGHSGFAEGIGTVDAYYEFARDDAAFDFATLSEHDIWMDDSEWETLREATGRFHQPGVFETFLGHEWTTAAPGGGHHNVLFRGTGGRRADRHRSPTLPDLYALLAAEREPDDVIVIPHAHTPGRWWESDPRFEPLVEIVSNHGTFEWLGRRYIASGYHLGFVGASDDHIGHPGLRALNAQVPGSDNQGGQAAVLATERSRDAIFDAMKARATYATNGHRIVLQATLNGAPMGAKLADAPRREITGRAIGTGPVDRIVIVKNGVDVQTTDFFEGASVESAQFVELRFWSESDPFARDVNSRGTRLWRGTLKLEGPGTITSVATPNTENVYTESARIAAGDPKTVEFLMRTRGHFRSVLVGVSGLAATSQLHLTATTPGAPGAAGRQNADEISERFAASDVAGAGRTLERKAGEQTDFVTLRLTTPPTERDRAFSFVDEQGSPGDTYWVRVVTSNGGMAWSSPIRVGDKPAT